MTWPHDKIHAAAVPYIRKHAAKETEWRFTRVDALPDQLARIVRLEPDERVIVSGFIDALRWHVMTTARVFGIVRGSSFTCAPLDVRQWRWGNFKGNGQSGVETATLSLADGTHLRFPYESGPAATAPIHYERFWSEQYPRLDQARSDSSAGT